MILKLEEKDIPAYEEEFQSKEVPQFEKLVAPSADSHKFELVHPVMLIMFGMYCLAGFYGAYVFVTAAKIPTMIFTMFMVYLSMMGLTAGAHRLWSHHAYKAKPPLEAFLVFCYLLTNQRTIFTWVRNHRQHHRCSDTDGDPHNATRGFFFSHFGWLIVKPHPEVVKREKYIDLSDLMANPFVRFEEKYIVPLLIVVPHVIPTLIPMLWGETFYVSLAVNYFRLNVVLHCINLINSAAHLVGYKPVDTSVAGTQYGFVGLATFGEGFHNYHHAFPYDYRASELGDVGLNLATRFIHFFEKIGWAYDLKTTSEETIRNRVMKKGDGTDPYYIPDNEGKQKFFCTKYYQHKTE